MMFLYSINNNVDKYLWSYLDTNVSKKVDHNILYTISHSTYYKYNDWSILQNSIYEVEEKYGDFDLGQIRENQKGSVGYYIYTDNIPIMPDHLDHFYYMQYDENGIVYNVYDGCQPGGWRITAVY